MGTVHDFHQGEGGEHGDALIPLCSLLVNTQLWKQ